MSPQAESKIMECSHCKSNNPSSAVFCEFCGRDLPKAEGQASAWQPPQGKRRTIIDEGPGAASSSPPPPSAAQTVPAPTPANPQRIRDVFGIAANSASNPPPPRPAAGRRQTIFDSPARAFSEALQSPESAGIPAQAAVLGRRIIGWLISFDTHPDGQSFSLREGRNTIGRDSDRDISVEDQLVSGVHATIQHRSGRTWVFDENSSNGTLLNGEDIFQDRPSLSDGDLLTVGEIRFLVKLIDPELMKKLCNDGKSAEEA